MRHTWPGTTGCSAWWWPRSFVPTWSVTTVLDDRSPPRQEPSPLSSTSPAWKIYRDLLATCRALALELGMTPGARARLGALDPSDAPGRPQAAGMQIGPEVDPHHSRDDPPGNSSSKARTASDCIDGST
jgi:hypothetical protein